MTNREILAVGARPYNYFERDAFFGRSIESERLAERVAAKPLTVLSAASGNGKSSLIEAGLLPQLMRNRLASVGRRLASDDPQRLDPTPIVVREWTSVDKVGFAGTVRRRVASQLRFLRTHLADADIAAAAGDLADEAIADERARLDAALAEVKKLPRTASATDVVRVLGAGLESVALVFDQMEEVLRNDAQRAASELALEQISKHLRDTSHLLVSFRSDIPANLMRSLERRIYLFSDQIQDLPSASSGIVLRDYVERPRKGAEDDTPGLQDLLTWLCMEVFSKDGRLKTLEFNTVLWALVQLPLDDGRSPDWQEALQRIHVQGHGTALDCMRRWTKQYARGGAKQHGSRSRDDVAKALAEWALERRLTELMSSARTFDPRHAEATNHRSRNKIVAFREKTTSEGLDEAVDTALELYLTQVSSLLVGPNASKVPVEETILRSAAYKREFDNRGQGRLSAEKLRAAGRLDEGAFYEKAFGELLYRLTPEVLKRSGSTYELTHDRLGPALEGWATSHEISPDFKVRVSHEGYAWSWPQDGGESQFSRWIRSDYPSAEDGDRLNLAVLGSVSWNASKVQGRLETGARRIVPTLIAAPAGSQTRVVFQKASMRRTLFRDCVLRGIRFVDCDLTGVIFENCSLTDVTFEGCAMVGAEFRGTRRATSGANGRTTLSQVVIRNSWARGAIIRHCDLTGCSFAVDRREPSRSPLETRDELTAGQDFGFYYMIIEDSAVYDDLIVSGTEAETCNWKGGAIRSTHIAGELRATDVDMTAFAFEAAGVSRLKYERCRLVAAVWIGDDPGSPVTVDIDDSEFASAVFRNVRLGHLHVNNGTSHREQSWGEGLIFRGGCTLNGVDVRNADLDGLHVYESCTIPASQTVEFTGCSLMRARFSDVQGEGNVRVTASALAGWQHDEGFEERLQLEGNRDCAKPVVTHKGHSLES